MTSDQLADTGRFSKAEPCFKTVVSTGLILNVLYNARAADEKNVANEIRQVQITARITSLKAGEEKGNG